MNLLSVEEHGQKWYPPRTFANAKLSDITVAFAINPLSAGEKLTKKAAIMFSKPFISIHVLHFTPLDASKMIISKLKETNLEERKDIIINVAGNSIFALRDHMNQEECNNYVYKTLSHVIQSLPYINVSIRSGGQSGFDEAGIKAGLRLGLRSHALFPKGYLYRSVSGCDNEYTYDHTIMRLITDYNSSTAE